MASDMDITSANVAENIRKLCAVLAPNSGKCILILKLLCMSFFMVLWYCYILYTGYVEVMDNIHDYFIDLYHTKIKKKNGDFHVNF